MFVVGYPYHTLLAMYSIVFQLCHDSVLAAFRLQDTVTDNGQTTLFAAANGGFDEIVSLLLRTTNVDLDAQSGTGVGYTKRT